MDDFAEVAHQCVDKVIHGLLFNVLDLLGEKVVGEDVWKSYYNTSCQVSGSHQA